MFKYLHFTTPNYLHRKIVYVIFFVKIFFSRLKRFPSPTIHHRHIFAAIKSLTHRPPHLYRSADGAAFSRRPFKLMCSHQKSIKLQPARLRQCRQDVRALWVFASVRSLYSPQTDIAYCIYFGTGLQSTCGLVHRTNIYIYIFFFANITTSGACARHQQSIRWHIVWWFHHHQESERCRVWYRDGKMHQAVNSLWNSSIGTSRTTTHTHTVFFAHSSSTLQPLTKCAAWNGTLARHHQDMLSRVCWIKLRSRFSPWWCSAA